MRMQIAVLVLAVAGACGTAAAGGKKTMELAPIVAEQQSLRADIQAAEGRFAALSPRTREDLLARQARLLALIDGKATTDDLPMTDRIEVFNALELIKAAVNDAHGEQMVCRREKPLGSNRAVTRCMKWADRLAADAAAQQALSARGAHQLRGAGEPTGN